jgi:hypothetical protein
VSQAPAGGARKVAGTLQSSADSECRIDLYRSSDCDPTGNGEGALAIGSAFVQTDALGAASFELEVAVFLPASLTATATDAAGNTSEFSACLPVSTSYNTVVPCRLVDTRGPNGPFAGPALSANDPRTFAVNPLCGIPASALALAVNVTVVDPTSMGFLTAYPGFPVPATSTLNYRAGQTRANSAILSLGEGAVYRVLCAQPSGSAHVLVDVMGYFE